MIEEQITNKAAALFGVVDAIYDFLIQNGVSENLASWLDEIISVSLLFIIAFITDYIARFIIYKLIERLAKYTTSQWDDVFVKNKVFKYLVHILPGIVFYLCTPIAIRMEI